MSLILDHINYTYNPGTAFESVALRDVCLKIEDGESVGIIGHTGSGKSTLIKHMNGLLRAQSGSVYYNGQDIYDSDFDLRGLRFQVGLVFQYPEYQLFEETVLKDVAFGPHNMGYSDKEAAIMAYEALKTVELEPEVYDQSPFDMSGGQKRRAAIAGVLAMKPSTLILDEPTAGLDPEGRRKMLDLIKGLCEKDGITVVMVSHSMEDMADYVNRIVVMDEGRVAMDADPHEVFSREEELRAMGLMVPQVSLVASKLAARGIDIRTDGITVSETADAIVEALRGRYR
ncbi:MAG: energy-coupling factor transporter ATPase [Eubacterium sp.]|nr:energy-coupling factor transporter ATPase [Eubacterium sp.]